MIFFRLSCFILLITGCSNHDQLTEKNRNRIIKECNSAIEEYYKSVDRHGLTAELDYLDNSEDFFWIPPGYKTEIDYDSVASYLKLNAPRFRSVSNKPEKIRILPLTGYISNYSCTLSSRMVDTSGKESYFRLREFGTLINRNGSWKLLCGQTVLLNDQMNH